jgi:hypothetical protein
MIEELEMALEKNKFKHYKITCLHAQNRCDFQEL